jgi:hypothetical protein
LVVAVVDNGEDSVHIQMASQVFGVLPKGANTENPVIRRLQFIYLVIQYGVTISRIFETELGRPFFMLPNRPKVGVACKG